jgi:hypothetical protein
MIISHVVGGLGNQMFQYAAGRALSIKHEVPLRLDISAFVDYELHQGFELKRLFNCAAETSTDNAVQNILGWQSLPRIRQIVSRPSMAAFRRNTFVVEPHFHYWPAIENVPSSCYLMGYWQSEKYFLEIAPVIRKDFTFISPLNGKNAELAKQINQTNAVSLHVRRGDYINNKNSGVYEICSIDYYTRSVEAVAGRVNSPFFYIFSDDMKWVRSNLKLGYPHLYVDINKGVDSYNDMRLMSMCNHHIIANSSFSWWAAWLNAKIDKLVVAPRSWFITPKNVNDLLPMEWLKL